MGGHRDKKVPKIGAEVHKGTGTLGRAVMDPTPLDLAHRAGVRDVQDVVEQVLGAAGALGPESAR